ncbi:MAG: DNA polymerase Y family protein, partial [Burkholderiales bacterium]|nr:DNA polymerase Y family protein [Burkholderiales bacterium]
MRWLALHLPQLPLEAFCATLGGAAATQPVALLAGHRVQAVNAAAAGLGVQAGCRRATALALAPTLRLAEADAARDAAALQAVAHAALAFTPAVCLHDAQTVLMEVQASLRLFGGLSSLRQRLLAALEPLGHRVLWAAAPTALGAALLAAWAACGGPEPEPESGPEGQDLAALQRRLDDAPAWLLGPGRAHWEALQGMGLQRLADLRALPRSGLARRLGTALLDELDRAYGRRPDPRAWLSLPAQFESRLELHTRADRSDQVLHGAGVLLARLVAWARAHQARVAAFTLQMQHEPRRGAARPATELHLALAEPALDAAHLQLLLRERLANLALAAPTLELRLHCRDLAAGPAPNGDLFPNPTGPAEGLARLLERLRARLGDVQVQRLEAVADHRPERATRTRPAQGGESARRPAAAGP